MSIRSVEFVAAKIQELPSTQVERYLRVYLRAVRLDEAFAALRYAVRDGAHDWDAVTKQLADRVAFLQQRAK